MPGFADCHTHSFAGLLKGTVDAKPLTTSTW
jgi:cytosine/adenosine deaminase-related metal-dependent hydrolase